MRRPWFQEAADQPPDPVSGAKITRLTNAVCINDNIYCEQPYCSKDGYRVPVRRQKGWALDPDSALLVSDLRTLESTLIDKSIWNQPFNNAWSGYLYYFRENRELVRLCTDTLEKEIVCGDPHLPADCVMTSVSPDQRYAIGQALMPGPTIGVVRLDLKAGTWDVIHEHPELINAHLQYNPVTGNEILVLHCRGSKMAADGTVIKRGGEEGSTNYVIDTEGNNLRSIAVGVPHTLSPTGHQCFVADTGKIVFTCCLTPDQKHDSRYPEGNLFTAAPGDEAPTVFAAPEHYFNHVCASRCGKYFLCDSYPEWLPGPVPLVIGNFETGKYRTLIQNCGATVAGAQYRHPHPYLTSENKHVVYNSDFDGIPHVYFAEIPDGFLESLD